MGAANAAGAFNPWDFAAMLGRGFCEERTERWLGQIRASVQLLRSRNFSPRRMAATLGRGFCTERRPGQIRASVQLLAAWSQSEWRLVAGKQGVTAMGGRDKGVVFDRPDLSEKSRIRAITG